VENKIESEWSKNWRLSNADYIKRNKAVEKVLERRRVTIKKAPGYIYAVKLTSGGFEVRTEVNGTLVKKTAYTSGTKAVSAYRVLRDKLVKPPSKKAATA
jgi:hypothetical protein